MKVLSTKTLDKEVIAHATSLGLNIQCVDFIKVNGIEFNLHSIYPNSFDSVAFTSANAVEYFLQDKNAVELLNGKNIFSLVGKTFETLSIHNIEVVSVGKNIDELANTIIQSQSVKSVLHVRGNLSLGVLEKKLKHNRIEYTSLIVYQTTLQSDIVVNNNFDVIMFYSPSGIESFLTNNKLSSETLFCCIGEATATSLKEKYNNAKIILPELPSPESMIAAIDSNCKQLDLSLRKLKD